MTFNFFFVIKSGVIMNNNKSKAYSISPLLGFLYLINCDKTKCKVMGRNIIPEVLNRCSEDRHQQSREADPPGQEKVKNWPH